MINKLGPAAIDIRMLASHAQGLSGAQQLSISGRQGQNPFGRPDNEDEEEEGGGEEEEDDQYADCVDDFCDSFWLKSFKKDAQPTPDIDTKLFVRKLNWPQPAILTECVLF